MIRTPVLQKWWPTTQSLELIRGSVEDVAAALRKEIERTVTGEPLAETWIPLATLDDAFASVREFTTVPTVTLAFPTHSEWTVLWSNSFHCSGHDALASGLTRVHGLESIHWSANDRATTVPPRAGFVRRVRSGAEVLERSVHATSSDGRWTFVESGAPLPEEGDDAYRAPEMRDRLNERVMEGFLRRKGATPWDESFYRLAPARSYRLERTAPPATIERRPAVEVIGGRVAAPLQR